MHKIYSRPRIKIFMYKNNLPSGGKATKNIGKLLTILFILAIALSILSIALKATMPIFETLCKNRAKSIATIVSNEQATIVMSEHSYDELFTIEKDDNGNITMIKSNIVSINEITSDVAVKIQNELNNKGKEDVKIALGSFSGISLLSNRGPNVKIRISTIGNIDTDLRSEFTSQGINQTLHRIYLHVSCKVNILNPFKNIEEDITNQVLLAENVIVGRIPSTYYNIEGLQNSTDALEVLE